MHSFISKTDMDCYSLVITVNFVEFLFVSTFVTGNCTYFIHDVIVMSGDDVISSQKMGECLKQHVRSKVEKDSSEIIHKNFTLCVAMDNLRNVFHLTILNVFPISYQEFIGQFQTIACFYSFFSSLRGNFFFF